MREHVMRRTQACLDTPNGENEVGKFTHPDASGRGGGGNVSSSITITITMETKTITSSGSMRGIKGLVISTSDSPLGRPLEHAAEKEKREGGRESSVIARKYPWAVGVERRMFFFSSDEASRDERPSREKDIQKITRPIPGIKNQNPKLRFIHCVLTSAHRTKQ